MALYTVFICCTYGNGTRGMKLYILYIHIGAARVLHVVSFNIYIRIHCSVWRGLFRDKKKRNLIHGPSCDGNLSHPKGLRSED